MKVSRFSLMFSFKSFCCTFWLMIHFELNSLDGVGQGLRFTLLAYGYTIITTPFVENETLILNNLMYINFICVMYNISCKHFLQFTICLFILNIKVLVLQNLFLCNLSFVFSYYCLISSYSKIPLTSQFWRNPPIFSPSTHLVLFLYI